MFRETVNVAFKVEKIRLAFGMPKLERNLIVIDLAQQTEYLINIAHISTVYWGGAATVSIELSSGRKLALNFVRTEPNEIRSFIAELRGRLTEL